LIISKNSPNWPQQSNRTFQFFIVLGLFTVRAGTKHNVSCQTDIHTDPDLAVSVTSLHHPISPCNASSQHQNCHLYTAVSITSLL